VEIMEINNLFGLPAHPLVVHAVVVLVPLVALGVVAMAVWSPLRARIGWLIAAGALVTLLLTPFATGSGEALKDRVSETTVLEEHTEMGTQLLPWVAALAVLTLLLMVLDRRGARTAAAAKTARATARERVSVPIAEGSAVAGQAGTAHSGSDHADQAASPSRPGQRSVVLRSMIAVLAALAIVAAVGSTVTVGLIGHSGAKATWSDVGSTNGGQQGE
jgi:hypothetical protein